MPFTFYKKDDNYPDKFRIEVDTIDFNFLLTQIACWVLEELEKWRKTGEFQNKKMKEKFSFADHGYENHILKGVALIYDFTKSYKNNSQVKSLVDKQLLAEVLSEYKIMKDLKRKAVVEEMGENWGSATKYVKWDPTKYVKEWLNE